MKAARDFAGRIGIPKPLREHVGFVPGEPLELLEREGKVEIAPAATPMALVREKGGLVARPWRALEPLTDEIVRATLVRTRR